VAHCDVLAPIRQTGGGRVAGRAGPLSNLRISDIQYLGSKPALDIELRWNLVRIPDFLKEITMKNDAGYPILPLAMTAVVIVWMLVLIIAL
jgi:hypothetical protein